MLRFLSILLVAVSLSAQAQYVGAAPIDTSADLSDTFHNIWDRIRGRTPRPPQIPPGQADLGRIISWNVQTLGAKASKGKKDALRAGLAKALEGAGPAIVAAQEIANDKGADTLSRQLPGEGRGWTMGFEDTSDAMNNAIYAGPGVRIDCSGNVPVEGVQHPPYMAHVTVDGVDFTLVSVHLSYAKGDESASADELTKIMAWVRAVAARPGADPDFIIAGDFNMPTSKGKELSSRSGERAWEPMNVGAGFTALVDDPTSRRGREDAANNYDHFIVSDDFKNEEFVVAGAVNEAAVVMAEKSAGTRASDHFPIALTFRKRGVGADGKPLALDGTAGVCP